MSPCYSLLVVDGKGRFPGIANGGLVGMIIVGAFFVALGVHARSDGYYVNRPMRPFFFFFVGTVLVGYPGIELVRRWRKRS